MEESLWTTTIDIVKIREAEMNGGDYMDHNYGYCLN